MGIYLGYLNEYPIPADLEAKAQALNGDKSLNDLRTRGGKLIHNWGQEQERLEREKDGSQEKT